MNKVLITIVALSFAQFPRAEPVSITLVHARAATEAATTHTGRCKDSSYEMRITYQPKKLQITLDTGSPVTVDLTQAPLGNAILQKPLAGTFTFACLRDVLQVVYYGFDVSEGAQPRPVSYLLELNLKGAVINDNGLRDEAIEVVAGHFISKAKR